MLLKTELNQIKTLLSGLILGCLSTSAVYALPVDCGHSNTTLLKKLCSTQFSDLRSELNEKYLTAYLITDAPIRLINDTNHLWFNRLQQCKSNDCLKQQFDIRFEDLNFYTSMNQSLTQHFIKYEHGEIAKQPIHLQIHQLTKDRIKVEGIAYRNPNNRKETQIVPLLAYTTPEKKNEILDNEHDCKYQLNFQKAILTVKTQQKGCERFTGIYRLYD
ncbi:A1S_1983 family putative colistin resistance protein [Acinetobacter wuhouensis]|uniref:DUF1311 domain-containing protein n=1 Tax=Acinetobacter wuhouensis TaxID=1879050 RepID=A0A3G2T234_9GAMM|nr:hypothetical protein [Acinetobacter wuhouensis]AYO54289.1 hypothetical protein CDG68_11855 [Acinetobacter wuhouensis]